MSDLTHIDKDGNAVMVDVSAKTRHGARATAQGRVEMQAETAALIGQSGLKKGDVLSVAQLAGIMGAKRTADLIPLCHPLPLSAVEVILRLDPDNPRSTSRQPARPTAKPASKWKPLPRSPSPR